MYCDDSHPKCELTDYNYNFNCLNAKNAFLGKEYYIMYYAHQELDTVPVHKAELYLYSSHHVPPAGYAATENNSCKNSQVNFEVTPVSYCTRGQE